MKKIALLLVIMTCWSCSVDDGTDEDFFFEIVAIETVELPESLVANQTNNLVYRYNLPSNCHSFNDLYYVEDGNRRTIAVVTLVTNTQAGGQDCETLNTIEEKEVGVFVPSGIESMIFKFWQGEDQAGQDVYLTLEVPVEEE